MSVAITIIIEKNGLRDEEHYGNIGEAIKFLQRVRDKHTLPINWNQADYVQKNENKYIEIVKNLENPYPKDIFTWNNKDKLEFNRGRFHQFCFELVENIRKKLLEEMEHGE
jgi:hypothetical protein